MNGNAVRLSVIIPAYNQAQYLATAIQSALAQEYPASEIIVIDDGSTDNSQNVVDGFGSQVRYIWQENQGLAGARNTGIQSAKGELVGLLDADDQWLPSYLDKMVALADQQPEATIYYCCAQGMDADGRDLPQIFGGPVRSPETIYQNLLRANFLIPSTVTMRRSAIMAAGLFDIAFRRLQDWELWIRLLKQGHSFIGLEDILVRYRIHGSSLSVDPNGGQRAAMALATKNFGPDDGQWSTWSKDKRRVYGGVYRYHLLTSVQRKNDWEAGELYLRQALHADPTLATDLDLFYELASGYQPLGQRGTLAKFDLEENAAHISSLLSDVFSSPAASDLESLRSQIHGTAYYALGLVNYNSGDRSTARHFLLRSLRFRPDLVRDSLVIGNVMKSFVKQSTLEKMKRYALHT